MYQLNTQVSSERAPGITLFLTPLRLMDGVLSRQTNNDVLEQNLSSFAHEMATVSLILTASTSNTLVILDEIGRGTTPSEGFGLAYAISEELIRRRPFVIFATHFRQLSTYLQFKPGVVTLHMATTVVLVHHR